MFAMGTDNFVVAGILPSVARDLDTSVSLAGQMVTFYAITYAVFAPVLAALTGEWPRKRLLILSLCIFVVGNVLSAIATDLWMVLFSRVVAGLGAAIYSPTALGVAAAMATPERRGRALATVTAGLAGATALGAPLGTFIGELGSWRTTLWFVALLGFTAMAGLALLLRDVPPPPTQFSLRERIAPVRDARVALTLLTSFFAFGGFLMVYTYAGLVLQPVTGRVGHTLAGLLLVWGIASTVGNVLSGRLVDRFDSRRMINIGLGVGIANFCLLPWTVEHPIGVVLALVVWGLCGWGLLVPQQHRLVKIAPQAAPLLLALNNTATYGGLACSGVLGGLVLLTVDSRYLPVVGATLVALAWACAECAHTYILRHTPSGAVVSRAT